MDSDVALLYQEIQRYLLDWRYPDQIKKVLKRIERGRLTSSQAKRWRKKIKPWIEKQKRCFNPLPPAPDPTQLGKYDIVIGESIERPGTQIGIRLQPGKHLIVCGHTGSGKSTVLRRIIDGLDAINRTSC